MRNGYTIGVVIPALNEQEAIARVISEIPGWVDEIIVADNGSTDNTAKLAEECGARVVCVSRRGYGSACQAGIEALNGSRIVVFLDGDHSDFPEEMGSLVDPIAAGEADMVIGSRMLGEREPGALAPQAHLGDMLACFLMRLFWRFKYTDLGPFRAIRYSMLKRIDMRDRGYGWTVEMQIKAVRNGLKILEVPARYRRRIGKSKISGTLKGVVGAGTKILTTIFRSALSDLLNTLAVREVPGHVIVFTRYPEPGRTKTRLIPVLGPDGAADFQSRMTRRMLNTVRNLAEIRGVSVEVRYEGGDRTKVRGLVGSGIVVNPQSDGDLGRRMRESFKDAFVDGAESVIIIGTDCPGLTAGIMAEALDAVKTNDLVLGPARDGGYYLVGLRGTIPPIFEGISWGGGTVFQETMRIANDMGLSVHLMEDLDDIDRPDDLSVWESVTGSSVSDNSRPRISVIMPALNEAEEIASALSCVENVPDVEVIVVDGGSEDGTQDIVRSRGVTILSGPPNRARQMNMGVEAASGETLLFLHADTRLPEGFDRHINRILADAGTLAGAFRFRTDIPSWSMRLIERLVHLRSVWLHMPYGDQAIFMRAEVFREYGGFPEMPAMEDFELMRRLRRNGRIGIAPVFAVTSGRRWKALGVWRTTLINQMIIAGYSLGISPERLARLYKMGTAPNCVKL